ncbi:hypothetical protein JXR93_02670, partial [bacterium]|nr:hypothetical protein [bacterium]
MKKIILTIFVLSLQIIGTNLFAEKITLKPSQPLSVKINNEDSIKLYSNLSAFKGIEVYVWKNSK